MYGTGLWRILLWTQIHADFLRSSLKIFKICVRSLRKSASHFNFSCAFKNRQTPEKHLVADIEVWSAQMNVMTVTMGKIAA